MKKVLLFLALGAAVTFSSCSYDDSALWDKVDEIEKKVSDLETLVNAMNNNIYVKSVTPTDTGYVIEFTDGKKATITNGVDGEKGDTGEKGEKGDTGATGENGADGDAYFKDVAINGGILTITLMNDTVITLKMYVDDAPKFVVKYGDAEVTEIALGDVDYDVLKSGFECELVETNIAFSAVVEFDNCYAHIGTNDEGKRIILIHPYSESKNASIIVMSVGTNGSTIITEITVSYDNVYFVDARDNNKYAVVFLQDGKWWMTQGLRYIPEGKTISDDPTTGTIWYPSASDKTADKTEETINKVGYYYSIETLLGDVTLTEENYTTFAGERGICPEGWYIPDVEDYANLIKCESYHKVGSSESANNYFAGSAEKAKLIADGFTFGTTGMVQKNTATATPVYAYTTNSCFWWSSKGKTWGDGVTTGQTTSYFYGVMAMQNDETGTIMIAQNSRFAGYAVRCVRW